MTNSLIRDEFKSAVKESAASFGDTLPELNYFGFALYTMIVPAILAEVSHSMLPESSISGPLWNYLDAGCSGLTGVIQLTDNNTHRPIMTKLKGLANIGNTIQLSTLTALNFAVFGGPAFAGAFGIGFVLSLDELIRSQRRLSDPYYWLKDSLTQLEKLTKLIPALQNEISEFDKALKSTHSRLGNWALERKKQRCKEYQALKIKLEEDIQWMVAYLRHQDFLRGDHLDTNPTIIKNIIMNVIDNRSVYPGFCFFLQQCLLKINQCVSVIELEKITIEHVDAETGITLSEKSCTRDNCNEAQNRIKNECKTNRNNAIKETIIWGLAFVGMLLCCFPIPTIQIAGLAVVGAASLCYMIKNASKVGNNTVCALALLGMILCCVPLPHMQVAGLTILAGAIVAYVTKKTISSRCSDSEKSPAKIASDVGFLKSSRNLVSADLNTTTRENNIVSGALLPATTPPLTP